MDSDLREWNRSFVDDRISLMRAERDDANKRVAELMRKLELAEIRLTVARDEVEYLRKKRLA